MLSQQIDQELNNLYLASNHKEINKIKEKDFNVVTSLKSSSLQSKNPSPWKKTDTKLHSLCLSSKKTAESFNFNFGMIDTDDLKKKNVLDPEQVL